MMKRKNLLLWVVGILLLLKCNILFAGKYQFTHQAILNNILSYRNGLSGFDHSATEYTQNCLHALKLFQQEPQNPPELIVWLQSCQNADGGFGKYPGEMSDIVSTFYAIHALRLLNAYPLNRLGAKNYIDSCQIMEADLLWPAGGYGYNPGDGKANSTLEATMYAVWALKLLGYNPQNINEVINFINSHQLSNGAYTALPMPLGSMAPGISLCCWWAGVALDCLNLEPPNKAGFIAFVRSLQTSNGGFKMMADDDQTFVFSTYHAIHALKTVNSAPFNVQNAVSYLQKCELPNGGFKYQLQATKPDYLSTYNGIYALNILSYAPKYQDAHIRWLLECQNSDFAFGSGSTGESNMFATYFSLLGLEYLNEPLFPVGSICDWVLSCEQKMGSFGMGFGIVPGGSGRVEYTHYAYYILKKFGRENESNSYAWVGGCRKPLDPDYPEDGDGGFASTQDDKTPSNKDTYHACMMYDILDKTINDIPQLKTYVNGCQTQSGGFANDKGKTLVKMAYSFYATSTLKWVNSQPT